MTKLPDVGVFKRFQRDQAPERSERTSGGGPDVEAAVLDGPRLPPRGAIGRQILFGETAALCADRRDARVRPRARVHVGRAVTSKTLEKRREFRLTQPLAGCDRAAVRIERLTRVRTPFQKVGRGDERRAVEALNRESVLRQRNGRVKRLREALSAVSFGKSFEAGDRAWNEHRLASVGICRSPG